MSRVSVLVALILVLSLGTPAAWAAEPNIPPDVQKAAEAGFEFVRERMAARHELFGFEDASDVKKLTLGRGFPMYFIDSEKLRSGDSDELLGVVGPVAAWEYTLDLDGQPRSFFTIAHEDGEYRVVGYGGDAREFGEAMNTLHRLTSDGTQANAVLVKPNSVYYLVTVINGSEVVVPTVSPDRSQWAYGMDNSKVWQGRDVVNALRKAQETGLTGQRGGNTATTNPSTPPAGHLYNALAVVSMVVLLGVLAAGGRRLRHKTPE